VRYHIWQVGGGDVGELHEMQKTPNASPNDSVIVANLRRTKS